MDRVKRLEEAVYGEGKQGGMFNRLDALESDTFAGQPLASGSAIPQRIAALERAYGLGHE